MATTIILNELARKQSLRIKAWPKYPIFAPIFLPHSSVNQLLADQATMRIAVTERCTFGHCTMLECMQCGAGADELFS